MKQLGFYLLLILGLSTTISCNSDQPTIAASYELLPQPQQLKVDGASALKGMDITTIYFKDKEVHRVGDMVNLTTTTSKEDAQVFCSIDSSLELEKEGYQLKIGNDGIDIVAKDEAGLFYALVTVGQVIQDAIDQEANLPIMDIVDYPSLSFRAIHLDMKHHLEQREYYYEIIDKLASYKVNAIIAEMEDKIAYPSHPVVASADALSVDEWIKLSNYAKERNIEISPLIQGLGHASFILKHDEYKDLRDHPESDWAFNPLDPKTYEVQFDLYRDAIAATPHGKYLHIGGDEVHTTGRNSGKTSLELQMEWLRKVCEFAAENDRIPIFWDDMPLKHSGVYRPMFNPDLDQAKVDSIWDKNGHRLEAFLDQFPKNCIYMRWNYREPTTLGNIKAMEWFSNNGFQVMGATAGQTRWVLMPQNESNIESIRDFADLSIQNNFSGLLCTLWDDDSPHFELYWRGILAFAEYTWAGKKREISEYKKAFRQRQYSYKAGDETFAFIDSLEKPVEFWKNALLTGNKRNQLMKMEDPSSEALILLPTGELGEWTTLYQAKLAEARKQLQTLDGVAKRISALKEIATRNQFQLEIYESVQEVTRFGPEILLALENFDASNGETDRKLALSKIDDLVKSFTSSRAKLEATYGKSRVLTKPDNYIIDQDHHSHLANQSINFDWQFYSEILFIEKLKNLPKE